MSKKIGIIGAGPAGLAAAAAIKSLGHEPLLWELGKPLEARHRGADIASGTGGAGLYSDGKFSYYPSGTELYKIEPRDALRVAYDRVCDVLSSAGIQAIPFPEGQLVSTSTATQSPVKKEYPSHYGSLSARYQFIETLAKPFRDNVFSECRVRYIDPIHGRYAIHYQNALGADKVTSVDALILAMGRFSGFQMEQLNLQRLPNRALRYEAGIRFEVKSTNVFFTKQRETDVKLKWSRELVSHRTFCTCRDGEVCWLAVDGISAISGRADGDTTGYSNFGLLTRFEGDTSAGALWYEDVIRLSRQLGGAIWQPALEILGHPGPIDIDTSDRPWHPKPQFKRADFGSILGSTILQPIENALKELLIHFPELATQDAICIFPAIESSQRYLVTNEQLRVPNEEIWVAGDQAGNFRGLIPALVSGYFCGMMASAQQ